MGNRTGALVRRLVDVREGELRPLLQAFFTLFGLIAGHTILETARDTLFLEKLPASRLTFVYALLAGLAFVSSSWNTRFVRAFGRRYALVFTLMIAAYGTTLLHFQVQTGATVFALYLWSGLLGTLMVIQFWMFAGQLFTLAQGKRLFGPIASGGVLGAVAGASTAALVLERLSVESLLLLTSGLFIATAVLLTTVTSEEVSTAGVAAPRPAPAPLGLRAVLHREPYVLRVALLVVASTAAVLVTDYLFKSVAASTYQGKDLGHFFARYYAVLNAVSLVVQVAIAGRVIRSQGVIVAMTVLPLLLVAGGVGLVLFGGGLALVLITKGADGSLRHSLHRVSSELLWMPVDPEVRDRGKALIDGVLARATQAVTAGLILALSMLGPTSPRVLAAIVVALAVAWIAVTVSLRRPYLDLFRRALRSGTLETDGVPGELDLGSVEAILESLSSRDPARVVAAMELLADRKRAGLIPGLVLYHESPEVLVRALELLSAGTRDHWLPLAERLLGHEEERVRAAVVRAFARRARPELLRAALDDPSPAVRAHAAFWLAHEDTTRDPRDDAAIQGLLALPEPGRRAATLALLEAIRDRGDPRWSELVLRLIAADDPGIVEAAAATMLRVKDERFVPILVRRLAVRDGRAAIRDALVELGDPALDALEVVLRDPTADPRVRRHVPRTISRFGTQRAADLLVEQLGREPSGLVRYKILRGLGRLVADHEVRLDRPRIARQTAKNLVEHLRLLSLAVVLRRGLGAVDPSAQGTGALVLGLVEDKAAQALERAFRLLQIEYREEDIRSIYLALSSKDRRLLASAQEFLAVLTAGEEVTVPGGDRRQLFALIADDLSDEERVTRAESFLPNRAETYAAALALLVRDSDDYVASLAGHHALELGAEGLREEVMSAYEARPSLREVLSRSAAALRPALGAVHG